MSTSTNRINIDVVGSYTGEQNFKKAHKDLLGIGEAAKKLAGAFAVAEIANFGKNAVLAFTKSEQAFKVLANTMSNLGLEAQSVGLSSYVEKLSLSTGTVKEQLIPALSTLASYTNDVTKAQELLSLSLDISAGTGKDLSTVSLALAKAYGGSNTALGKLGAGLTSAELKSNSFIENQKILASTWGGSAAAAADTFKGKIDRITIAYDNFKENLGRGIVSGFDSANASAETFQKTLEAIQNLGTYVGAIIGQVIKSFIGFFSALSKLPYIGDAFKNLLKGFGNLINYQKTISTIEKARNAENAAAAEKAKKDAAAQAKIQAERLAAQKKADAATLAAANAKLKAERDALNLKLAGSTADMQNIEIQAALQRGQSAQVNDVLLLQRAILNQNGDQAEILAQKVLTANNLVMDVGGNISSLSTAKNPFADWPTASQKAMSDIQAIELELAKLTAKPYVITLQYAGSASALAPTVSPGGNSNTGNGKGGPTDYSNYVGTASGIVTPSVTSINPINGADRNGAGGITVNFQVDGTTLATAVAPAVQDAIVQNTASGTAAVYSRSSTARVGDW